MQPRFYTKRCCCSSSTLAEAVANIIDLLTEILVRVPARPLVRFKCVSKHWHSLISDPKFCHHHTLRNPKTPVSAVFAGRSTGFSFVPLDLYYDPNCNHGNQNISDSRNFNPLNFVQHLHDIVILQSCNGLFLCCSLSISETTFSCSSLDTSKPTFYVLNPTTNQFFTLILPAAAASASASAQLFGYALAFDPSKSPHYKIVFLQTITATGNFCPYYHIHIYSSENRSWRLLNSSFVRLPNVFYKQGVYCNGAVHWVGMDDEIAYYHIDDERVGFLFPSPPPPPIKCESRWSRYFQASHCGSHLQLVDIYVTSLTRFEVLEMGKDYSGWFLKYHLDLDPKLAPFPCLKSFRFTVLFVVPEEVEGEESSSMLMHYPGKVISYNFKSNIFKSFELPSRPGVDDSKLRVYHYGRHQYKETLACV